MGTPFFDECLLPGRNGALFFDPAQETVVHELSEVETLQRAPLVRHISARVLWPLSDGLDNVNSKLEKGIRPKIKITASKLETIHGA